MPHTIINTQPDTTPTSWPLEDLRIHPAIKGMPRLATEDARYVAMRATWLETGFLPPIVVTPDGQIVDGRHRYWFALEQGMTRIPVVEISQQEVAGVVISGICGKNHSTKGQRAYLAVPFLSELLAESQRRRLAILTSGGKTKLPHVLDSDGLAERMGLGRDLLFQARRLHDAFSKTPTLREEFEPRILAAEDPIGLGAALAGIAGKTSTENKARSETRNTAIYNWGVGWKSLAVAVNRGWKKWTDEDRAEAAEAVRTAATKFPRPLLEDILQSAKDELKKRAQTDAVTTEAE